ncbi:hypothetical protein ACJX0J_023883, partial [Zea mays]
GKERCLTELSNELKILETEHAECPVKARSNRQIKSFSVGLHSKGNTCNTEVIKGFFRSCLHTTRCWRYCVSDSLLGAISIFISVMSSVKLLSELKNELRIPHIEHNKVLMKIILNEHVKSLRKFSLSNMSVVIKINPSFDVHVVVHYKIVSTDQVCTSSTSCLSLTNQNFLQKVSKSMWQNIT